MVKTSAFDPDLKRLMDRALPQGLGGHVLALGSDHRQTSHNIFISKHLDTLKASHNLGMLGCEGPPYMDVFLWAYRDKNLPVPPHYAQCYMRMMWGYHAARPLAEATQRNADTFMQAIDRGVDVCNFDSRHPLPEQMRQVNDSATILSGIFKNDRSLQEELRINPEAFCVLWDVITRDYPHYAALSGQRLQKAQEDFEEAFVLLEARDLLSRYPRYQQWLSNIEAVIDAGRKFDVGEDALSAAILAASCNPATNTITSSGLNHVIGVVNQKTRCQGTFAQHLAAQGLPMQTAMVAHPSEIFCHLSLEPTYHSLKMSGMPEFEWPRIIRVGSCAAHALFQEKIDQSRRDYAKTPTPNERIYGAAYLARMKNLLDTPVMQEKLSQLRAPYEQGR